MRKHVVHTHFALLITARSAEHVVERRLQAKNQIRQHSSDASYFCLITFRFRFFFVLLICGRRNESTSERNERHKESKQMARKKTRVQAGIKKAPRVSFVDRMIAIRKQTCLAGVAIWNSMNLS